MSEAGQANGFLIDGFPREIDQAKIFEETVSLESEAWLHISCYHTGVPLFPCASVSV